MRYLAIEAPDTKATIDFLDQRVSIELTLTNGKLEILVRQYLKDDAYQWFNLLNEILSLKEED